MKQKIQNNKQEGITLIALVVTIVVLLILAGVSISLVLGENGLIAKAKEAREKTQIAALNDEVSINNLYDEIDGIVGTSASVDGGENQPAISVSLEEKTTTSITISTTVTDASMPTEPTYYYYIKASSSTEYSTAQSNNSGSYKFTGLVSATTYDIKVEVTDNNGNLLTGTLTGITTNTTTGSGDISTAPSLNVTLNSLIDRKLSVTTSVATYESSLAQIKYYYKSIGDSVYTLANTATSEGDYTYDFSSDAEITGYDIKIEAISNNGKSDVYINTVKYITEILLSDVEITEGMSEYITITVYPSDAFNQDLAISTGSTQYTTKGNNSIEVTAGDAPSVIASAQDGSGCSNTAMINFVQGPRMCDACSGTGHVECYSCVGTGSEMMPCTNCGGTGNILVQEPCYNCMGSGCDICGDRGFVDMSNSCTTCGGSGMEGTMCAICGGTGQMNCEICGGSGYVN